MSAWKWCAVIAVVLANIYYALRRNTKEAAPTAKDPQKKPDTEQPNATDPKESKLIQDEPSVSITEKSNSNTIRKSKQSAEKKSRQQLKEFEDPYPKYPNTGRLCKKKQVHEQRIVHLHALLDDIYPKFIAVRDKDFDLYFGVFNQIFLQIHNKMKDVSTYYKRYSIDYNFTGSHYDGLRIRKPDEFDMDVIISLPVQFDENLVQESDITIQHHSPGYVHLRLKNKLLYQNMAPEIITVVYKWIENDNNYLLRSKFLDWFKGVVNRAFNDFENKSGKRPLVEVNGVVYKLGLKESGPAITLVIERKDPSDEEPFQCDVDLVPALKFSETRWPVCDQYRGIPEGCKKDYWMVVPKANKEGGSQESRCWRVALPRQEKRLMFNCQRLKQSIRFMKKLRDALGMEEICSYYIKSIYYETIIETRDKRFWNQRDGVLFKYMVKRLYKAIDSGYIPYFWHNENNLIGHVEREKLVEYKNKLNQLLEIIDDNTKFKYVAKYILTEDEFDNYNREVLHLPDDHAAYRRKIKEEIINRIGTCVNNSNRMSYTHNDEENKASKRRALKPNKGSVNDENKSSKGRKSYNNKSKKRERTK